MRLLGPVLAAAALGALAPAHHGGAAGGDPPSCDFRKAGLDPAPFYVYLTEDTPYWKWERWPGTDVMRPGGGFHGEYATTYGNPTALASIRAGTGMAVGSLIVLESFDRELQSAGISVMFRIRGFDPATGDWHWSRYDARGIPVVSGRSQECLACHGGQGGGERVTAAPPGE